jgi:putative GTP pyrophosphokinase
VPQATAPKKIPGNVQQAIQAIVSAYGHPQLQDLLENFRSAVERPIRTSSELSRLVHSVKGRLKDPDHLRHKLERRYRERAKRQLTFDVTPLNLTTKINDLVGVRVLHLHTRQFTRIDAELRALFREYKFKLVEGPFARTWDDEYREYFRGAGIKVQPSPSMYTSVHYILASASKTQMTCELQVRTLMEEVWGEVDHTVNYPDAHRSEAMREQIRTLARSTSAATRLVDCIFACDAELSGSLADTLQSRRKSQSRALRPRR